MPLTPLMLDYFRLRQMLMISAFDSAAMIRRRWLFDARDIAARLALLPFFATLFQPLFFRHSARRFFVRFTIDRPCQSMSVTPALLDTPANPPC